LPLLLAATVLSMTLPAFLTTRAVLATTTPSPLRFTVVRRTATYDIVKRGAVRLAVRRGSRVVRVDGVPRYRVVKATRTYYLLRRVAYTVRPSGGDDTAAIQAAVDACGTKGGTITLVPGVYTISSSIELPPGNAAMLTLSGYGATVKLVGAVGFLDFDRSADHQSFRHFKVAGFAVDASQRKNVRGAALIGCFSDDSAYFVRRGNVEHIRVRDVHLYGAPSVSGDASCWGIALGTKHEREREATRTYVRDIRIDNVRIEGGDTGIVVAAQLSASTQSLHANPFDMNAVVDEIEIGNVSFVSGRVPPFTDWESNTGIMVNQHGKGGRLYIHDCYLQGTGDDLCEINSMSRALVENVHATETYDLGFQLRNQGMTLDGTQLTTYRDCTYVAGREPNGIGFGFARYEVPRSTIVYDDCAFIHQDGTVTIP
jgi:hypothetical protein